MDSAKAILKQQFDVDGLFRKRGAIKGSAFVVTCWYDSAGRRYGSARYVQEKYLEGREYTLSLSYEKPHMVRIDFTDELYEDGAEIRRLTDTKLEPEKFGR